MTSPKCALVSGYYFHVGCARNIILLKVSVKGKLIALVLISLCSLFEILRFPSFFFEWSIHG